jgi:hypothetical protein
LKFILSTMNLTKLWYFTTLEMTLLECNDLFLGRIWGLVCVYVLSCVCIARKTSQESIIISQIFLLLSINGLLWVPAAQGVHVHSKLAKDNYSHWPSWVCMSFWGVIHVIRTLDLANVLSLDQCLKTTLEQNFGPWHWWTAQEVLWSKMRTVMVNVQVLLHERKQT